MKIEYEIGQLVYSLNVKGIQEWKVTGVTVSSSEITYAVERERRIWRNGCDWTNERDWMDFLGEEIAGSPMDLLGESVTIWPHKLGPLDAIKKLIHWPQIVKFKGKWG